MEFSFQPIAWYNYSPIKKAVRVYPFDKSPARYRASAGSNNPNLPGLQV
jgi:hypothetical protein